MSASDELRDLVAHEGLGDVPIPMSLGAQLVRVGDWYYATPSAPRISPYWHRQHCAAATDEDAPSSLVVAHAGHGANSYALSYYLVLGRVRLLLQLGYGGVYMDNATAARKIRLAFDAIGRNLAALEHRATHPPTVSRAASASSRERRPARPRRSPPSGWQRRSSSTCPTW